MDFVSIEFSRITPRVLKAYYYSDGEKCKKRHELGERTVYDYETELITYSDGGMYIDRVYYPVSKGDIIFRRPGQTTKGILPYTCYAVILDLMDNTGKNSDTYDFHKPQEYQQNYSCPSLDRVPPVIRASSFEQYSILFDAILKEHINPGPDSAMLLKSYCLQLLCGLSREALRPEGCKKDGSAYRVMIKNVMDYVEQNISKRIMLKDLAAVAGMSPNYFHRVFSKAMGITPNEFVISRKISRARELLATTSKSISDISVICGFDNMAYFSYVFKRYSGITPSSFRTAYSYPVRQP
ncbi:MAG: helix-turn-helix transcriptional regulator [Clostridiaceae bacterium]|jgi:AraC-like DNA-binding protein|nr:helix-turn-helix transcriptional regulator [Clostridiaceae bacterium]